MISFLNFNYGSRNTIFISIASLIFQHYPQQYLEDFCWLHIIIVLYNVWNISFIIESLFGVMIIMIDEKLNGLGLSSGVGNTNKCCSINMI